MATTVGTTARCCANIQIALNSQSDYAPDADRESLGMLNALRSAANREGVDVARAVSQFAGNGGLPGDNENKLEILYEKPDCDAAAQTDVDICGSLDSIADTRGYLEVTVEKVSARGGTFTLDEFDSICETPNERLAKTIRRLARSIRKDIDVELIKLMTACLSNYSDGTDSADVSGAATKTLNILNGGGYVNAGEWAKLKSEYRKQFSMQDAIVVGGDILSMYNDMLGLGGRGPNAIGSTGSASIMNPYFVDFNLDSTIATALAAPSAPDSSFAVSWIPGSAQFLEILENVGYKEYFYDKSTRTTLTIDGMTYDWRLIFEECPNPVWKFVLSKRYDLFCIPEAAYSPCFGSNGKLLWMLGCGAASC